MLKQILILAIKIHENGKDKEVSTLPENITEDGTGYIFDTTKSVCSNKSIPSWDYKNKALITKNLSRSGTSCYLYFTTKPIITSVEKVEETSSTMKLRVNTSGASTLKYYYSINNGEFIESNDNEHIFNNLSLNTEYTIKIKVKDTYGNESEIKDLTERIGAANYILSGIALNDGTPNYSKTSCSSGCGEATVGVYKDKDDDGDSYYFRGDVENNYLKFANKWWRIIRINGDGTIRIIYDGTEYHANGTSTDNNLAVYLKYFNTNGYNNTYVGFMYGEAGQTTYEATHSNINKSNIMIELETWYENNLETYNNKIDINAGFCGDRTKSTSYTSLNNSGGTGTIETYYGSFIRLSTNKSPNLKCTQNNDLYTVKGASKGNKALDKPIGLITADEVSMAGGLYNIGNYKFYLYNGKSYWTMSPCKYDSRAYMFTISGGDLDFRQPVNQTANIRPVINLRADVAITGTGTGDDPFVVVGAE